MSRTKTSRAKSNKIEWKRIKSNRIKSIFCQQGVNAPHLTSRSGGSCRLSFSNLVLCKGAHICLMCERNLWKWCQIAVSVVLVGKFPTYRSTILESHIYIWQKEKNSPNAGQVVNTATTVGNQSTSIKKKGPEIRRNIKKTWQVCVLGIKGQTGYEKTSYTLVALILMFKPHFWMRRRGSVVLNYISGTGRPNDYESLIRTVR